MKKTLVPERMAEAMIKTVAHTALKTVQGVLVMGNLVTRDFEPVLARSGDTVNVPVAPVLRAANNMHVTQRVSQPLTLGNRQIILTQHIEANFTTPNIEEALDNPTRLASYIQPASIAIAERIDQDLFDLVPLFLTNPAVGKCGLPLNEGAIDSVETLFYLARVPIEEPKFLVTDALSYKQLRQEPRFTETGRYGRMKGLDIYRSVFGPVGSFAFTRKALAMSIRRLPKPLPGCGAIAEYAETGDFGLRVVMCYRPESLQQHFTIDILYGVGIMKTLQGIRVNP